MIYNVTKSSLGFSSEVDDNKLFNGQPKAFREVFEEIKEGQTAGFDNCSVLVLPTGRLIITLNEDITYE